jgi:hypothetical protein
MAFDPYNFKKYWTNLIILEYTLDHATEP